jgi:hypothetical protein
MNPIRKGLRTHPRDYPHSGSFVTDRKKIMRPTKSWVPVEGKSKSARPKGGRYITLSASRIWQQSARTAQS